MTLSRTFRRFMLTWHIVTSVGWLGAVLAYLALDITATAGEDIASVRAAYFAMDLTIRYVIVPLSMACVLIGTANALTSVWGLLQHYWVLVKLLLTAFATVILLLEVKNVTYMAEIASTSADPRNLPGSLPHSIGALIILVTVSVLSVYKPKGLTLYGWKRQVRDPDVAVKSDLRLRFWRRPLAPLPRPAAIDFELQGHTQKGADEDDESKSRNALQ
jgi:hypothetical protein